MKNWKTKGTPAGREKRRADLEFNVLRKTERGNLLLQAIGGRKAEGRENEGMENKKLFFEGKKACVVFDTIASVGKPFYLAKPVGVEGEILVGKTVRAK